MTTSTCATGSRWFTRRVAGGAALLALLVASCSVSQAMPPPDCVDGGSLVIVAQSVPTAALLPCLEPLPDGWLVATVKIDQNHSVVTLDSDRAGSGAAVLRLEPTCDVAGSVSAPSDQAEAARFDFIERLEPSYRATRYYLFAGGCVSWTFDFDRGTSATEAVAIADTLTLVSRRDFNDSLRETFVDEDL